MIIDGIEYVPVTTDDELHARLRRKAGELSTTELTDYVADELGLRPPGYRTGEPIPLVTEVFPPDGDSIVIWDLFDDDDEGETLPDHRDS